MTYINATMPHLPRNLFGSALAQALLALAIGSVIGLASVWFVIWLTEKPVPPLMQPNPPVTPITSITSTSGNLMVTTSGSWTTISSGSTITVSSAGVVMMAPMSPEESAFQRQVFDQGQRIMVAGPSGGLVPCYVPAAPLTVADDASIHAVALRHHLPIITVGDKYCVDP